MLDEHADRQDGRNIRQRRQQRQEQNDAADDHPNEDFHRHRDNRNIDDSDDDRMVVSDEEKQREDSNDSGDDNANDEKAENSDNEEDDDNLDQADDEEQQQIEPCEIPIDTLITGRQDLSGDDPCPACQVSVRRHLSKAAIDAKYLQSMKKHQENIEEVKSDKSSSRVDKDVLKIVDSLSKSQQLQFHPPDNRHPSVQPYLDQLQAALEPFSEMLPPQRWYRVFALLISKCSEADRTEIYQKIIQPKLDWPALCTTLRLLFDKTEYMRVLSEAFAKIQQGAHESVRSFNTRFNTDRLRLGYSDADATLPAIYLKGLRLDIRNAYELHRRQLHTGRILQEGSAAALQAVPAHGHPELKKIQEACLELDQRSADIGDDGILRIPLSKMMDGMRVRNTKRRQHDRCKLHPTSNHSDAQCNRHRAEGAADRLRQQLKNKRKHGAASSQDTPPPKRTNGVAQPNNADTIVCFTCGKKGHKSPDCRSNLPPNQWRNEQMKNKGENANNSNSSSSAAANKPWLKDQKSQNGGAGNRTIQARRARQADSQEQIEDETQSETTSEPATKLARHNRSERRQKKLAARKASLDSIDHLVHIARASLAAELNDDRESDDESH